MGRDRTNLLKETINELKSNGKTPEDVEWVGDNGIYFTWDEFSEIAEKTNYDAGYGGNKIIGGLVVVGEDWWLTRGEYDGSEWWDFHRKPDRPKHHIKPKHVNENWCSGVKSIKSHILDANFESEEEFIEYLREQKLENILDKEPK